MSSLFAILALLFTFLSGRAYQAAKVDKRHSDDYDNGYDEGFLDGLDGYHDEDLRDKDLVSFPRHREDMGFGEP
jgi:hypothetical protein